MKSIIEETRVEAIDTQDDGTVCSEKFHLLANLAGCDSFDCNFDIFCFCRLKLLQMICQAWKNAKLLLAI